MNDFYTEQLIKKRSDGKDMAIKAGLLAATALALLIGFFMPLLILLPVLVIAADVLVFRRLDVEYEYIYINGDLDIDKVMHKAKRKHMFSGTVNDMEILAPEGHPELRNFRPTKVYDYSTGQPGNSRYVMILKKDGAVEKVIFEPNAKLVEGIFLLAPRKVIQK